MESPERPSLRPPAERSRPARREIGNHFHRLRVSESLRDKKGILYQLGNRDSSGGFGGLTVCSTSSPG